MRNDERPPVPAEPVTDRPILAVDVDGVISVFGFEHNFSKLPGNLVMVDGVVHCIAKDVGSRLGQLREHFDLVWATGWEDRANDHLPHLLGLPEELPTLSFNGEARFGSAHWKLGAIADYAGERPLAWVDDFLDEECHDWARSREAPTLLVPTESAIGLTDTHVETLIGWVDELAR